MKYRIYRVYIIGGHNLNNTRFIDDIMLMED